MSRTSFALAAAKVFWNDPARKSLPKILGEVAVTAVRERELPIHYVSHMLYRQGIDPRDYIGHKSLKRAQHTLFEPRDPDLDDKIRFAVKAEKLGIPVPRQLALTSTSQSADELMRILLAAREHSYKKSIFVKPNDGISGKGCYRIDADTSDDQVRATAASMAGNVYLVQETLVQHPDVSAVHPAAINCARIHTIREGKSVTVLPSLMRFGVGKRVVDTPSGGAIFAALDIETGRVASTGMTQVVGGGMRYTRHPETGTQFADVTLPFWDTTLDVVRRAATGFDKHFVGWDVAFTESGPVFTEGNSNPHMMLAQVAAGGFRGNPAWWRVIEPTLA